MKNIFRHFAVISKLISFLWAKHFFVCFLNVFCFFFSLNIDGIFSRHSHNLFICTSRFNYQLFCLHFPAYLHELTSWVTVVWLPSFRISVLQHFTILIVSFRFSRLTILANYRFLHTFPESESKQHGRVCNFIFFSST